MPLRAITRVVVCHAIILTLCKPLPLLPINVGASVSAHHESAQWPENFIVLLDSWLQEVTQPDDDGIPAWTSALSPKLTPIL